MLPFSAQADSYTSLWKQYETNREKDLPQSCINILSKISTKAQAEKRYGHLLKAQVLSAAMQTLISPDSMKNELTRLEEYATRAESKDKVLAAVYQTAIGKIYANYNYISENSEERSKEYFEKAMSNMSLLANAQSIDYDPWITKGIDSKIFYDDLLHVIGIETGSYNKLYEWYRTHNNKAAACICAAEMLRQQRNDDTGVMKKSKYIQRLDSLIDVFGDLREAGELAIERYDVMESSEDVQVEDKIKYINLALSRWGAWPRMNILRNKQTHLTSPMFNVSIGEQLSLPNTPRKVLINQIRNINTLTLNVYRLNVDGDTKLNPSDAKEYTELMRGATLVDDATQGRRYIGQPAYKEITDSMQIIGLPVGVYMVEISTDNKNITPDRALLNVSNMFVVSEVLPDKRIRLAALDATTGQPIPGAKIRLKTRTGYNKPDEVVTLTCGQDGEAVHNYKNQTPYKIYVYTENDKAAPETNFGGSFSYYDNKRDNDCVNVYTDRRIYRPGQTVHVAVITYRNLHHEDMSALGNQNVTLRIYDANGEKIGEKTVITDELGTGSADFILPQSGLTGQFRVNARFGQGGSTYFSVEEYKRPTFEVEFDKVSENYQAFDTIKVVGHARSYAGVPVQGAKVKYNVVRRRALWWWYVGKNDNQTLATDTITTDADGKFVVEVPLIMPEDLNERRARFYNFVVEADVTDAAGETHSGNTSIPLSTKPTALSCDIPAQIVADSLKTIRFSYKNNAGEEIPGNVTYWIDDVKYTGEANKTLTLLQKSWKSMRHHLKAICGNDTIEQDFVTFSMNDKHPAIETHDWFYQSATTFPRDGKPVYIQFGSSDENQHVLYTIISGKQVLESGTLDQSNAVTTRAFTYKEEYGNGILITYVWVRNGKAYSHKATISRPLPDKTLNLKWTTFRDRLTPGQKETWTLNITDSNNKPTKAQLLAVLYDKSLDNIREHRWNFSPQLFLNLPNAQWVGSQIRAVGLYGFMEVKDLNERDLDFSHFDDDVINEFGAIRFASFGSRRLLYGRGVMLSKSMAPMAEAKMAANVMTDDMEESMAVGDAADAVSTDETEAASNNASQVRENLAETAFFYPSLTTDGNGNVAIKFTLPESITTWRFMGLAHDKDMRNGMVDGETVAKKTVMVQPNMPRFVRNGDQAKIAARLFNSSENKVSGTAMLQLINPETEKVVYSANKKYVIDANGTSTVDFDVDLSDANLSSQLQQIVICRITASGKNYSDGEQHYLPILPNEELVLNTYSFTQNEPGTLNIDVDKLFDEKDPNGKLTIEYTNNPAWLMIQALPTVGSPCNKDAISQAAAYYANSIGRNILNQSPKIKQVINLWKQEKGNETSLMSSLQKNSELKTLLLNETPWVMDAKNESEQKQLLINFFDESGMQYRLNSNLQKLQSLQNSDGSWSWWPGMPSNRYITTSVTEMLVRLNTLIGKQDETSSMIARAFKYLDKKIAEEVAEMKLHEKKGEKNLRPSDAAVSYLYSSALHDKAKSADMTYLVDHLADKATEFTIYGKAVSSIILNKYGYPSKAKEYLESIRQYTVYKEEMGRYFDTPKAFYSWFDYRIPTEVAAIEAIKMLQPEDRQTVQEMQRWLLQEKRTQSWDTPINSVNAVYAFLNGETDKLNMQGEPSVIKLDGKTLEMPTATAGLGYVKKAVNGSSAKTVTIDKTSQGTSWGAVYAQFMQKATDIKAASSGLTVTREVKAKKESQLGVGDRVVVRITIEADRDYDFVQVIDKRAACLEPVEQLSGYHWGYYCSPLDNSTNYYFDCLSKGKHVVETEYYIDRVGEYQTGTCTAQCAYSPEYTGRAAAQSISVK